jgi:hypothetical protein
MKAVLFDQQQSRPQCANKQMAVRLLLSIGLLPEDGLKLLNGEAWLVLPKMGTQFTALTTQMVNFGLAMITISAMEGSSIMEPMVTLQLRLSPTLWDALDQLSNKL